ncbi:MAG TPA: hypothetical protein VIU61_06430 [Kofleriaceae bacterium]
MSHPNLLGRKGAPTGDVIRVMVYAPVAELATWIESELKRRGVTWQTARTVPQILAGLIDDPPPRAQILVADFGPMSPIDVLQLHGIRERGWFGVIIGLGEVSTDLRKSLQIEAVIGPPYKPDALVDLIGATKLTLATTKIPTFPIKKGQ